mmetsp:Transcript_12820/g.24206  ORF Transcript_12820/g.24206 Transcript_12820/m.24206 type:complete len:123 (+) Transcript_12820:1662-2030(+)
MHEEEMRTNTKCIARHTMVGLRDERETKDRMVMTRVENSHTHIERRERERQEKGRVCSSLTHLSRPHKKSASLFALVGVCSDERHPALLPFITDEQEAQGGGRSWLPTKHTERERERERLLR